LVRIVKLDDFYFLYPPTVKRRWRRVGGNEIRITGRLVNKANFADLRRTCERDGPMPFESALGKSEVVVKYLRSKGPNYRILLLEYSPLQLKRRDAKTDTIEDIGRAMFQPRFEVRFISKPAHIAIGSDSFGLHELSIHVEVNHEMKCHFAFEHYASQTKLGLGLGVSLGDRVEVRLGFVGMMELVYSGVLTKLEETHTRRLDFTAVSVNPDIAPGVQQRYTYFLTPQNIIELRFEEDNNGLVQSITAPGLPHVKPGDRIDVLHTDRRLQSRFPIVNEVVHDFDWTEGFLTRITIR
jgi:hypothetical protein